MSTSSDAEQANRSPLALGDRLALRPKEAAAALGVCGKTLRKWMQDEGLPFFRIDRGVLIPTKELEGWMRARLEQTQTTDDLADEILRDL